MKQPLAADPHELHVDLDTVPGPIALEELQLARLPLPDRLHPGQPELSDHVLDRGL